MSAQRVLRLAVSIEQLLLFDFESPQQNLSLEEARKIVSRVAANQKKSAADNRFEIEDLSGAHLPDKSKMIQRL